MPQAFISFSHEDENPAMRLCESLRSAGITVYFERTHIQPERRWKNALREFFEEGGFFIACLSDNYLHRHRIHANEEYALALDELREYTDARAWFIPVFIQKFTQTCPELTEISLLADIPIIPLFADWERGIGKILALMNPREPRSNEERWRQEDLKRGRHACNLCGVSYNEDNIYRCQKCGAYYCYHCIWNFAEPEGGPRRCPCGGMIL